MLPNQRVQRFGKCNQHCGARPRRLGGGLRKKIGMMISERRSSLQQWDDRLKPRISAAIEIDAPRENKIHATDPDQRFEMCCYLPPQL